MAEPLVQYAKTSDGVNIAYTDTGEGPPLVFLSVLATAHVQRVWDRFPNAFEPLARGFRLINYDHRGGGLSDRDATDYSMEAMMRDFSAVVERTGLHSFTVLAFLSSVPIAVTYAARFPDRISHLILIDGWARSVAGIGMPAFEASEALKDKDWTLFTDTLARVLIGFDDPQIVEGFGEYIRDCIDPDSFRALNAAMPKWEVTDMLSKVTAQTLVLHNNNAVWAPTSAGRELAAGIPNARFRAIDDLNYAGVVSLVADFVGVEVAPPNSASQTPGGMTAILFLDISSSTALTEQLGDTAFRDRARQLDEALLPAIADAGGSIVDGKLLGDGVLATFASARQAIEAARRCRDASAESGLALHLGIHAGDVIREEGNVFGGAVNLAARIADASAPGEILVSDTMRGLARTSAGVAFEDRGEHELKGIAEPQRLFAVVEQD